jgi:heptosyltransferase-2
MTRALVVAPQWIGDAVMSEPLIARLAGRGERVAVAALPWVAPVYCAIPAVVEVIEWPFAHGRLDLASRWRAATALRGRFDVAYLLPNSIKSALVPWWAGIPVRVGYRGEGRRGLVNRMLPNPGGRPPMVAYYSALAGPATQAAVVEGPRHFDGRAGRLEERPGLSLPADFVASALRHAGLERARYWAFAPGAEYGPAKRWPIAHYADLARALHRESGRPVMLLGSPGEAALCDEIVALAPAACRVLAGRLSLLESIAVISAAKGVVTNDSGLMHVAAAFEVPQVAVFGSTSPGHTPPLSPRARVLWLKDELGLDCMPCFDRTCRFGHYGCLTGVRPERVEAALAETVGTHSAA